MELATQREPLTAAEINRNITQGRFLRGQGEEKFKFQPSLIYKLMKDLHEGGLLVRDQEENTYQLLPKGRDLLRSEIVRLSEFSNDLQEFISEAKGGLNESKK
jgi:DNA-binding PadR family transcriptional regulator